MSLTNLRVLITGASGDLGTALVQAFKSEGARVAGLGWTREVSNHCEKKWNTDFYNSGNLKDLFDQIVGEWGPVDVLINNAGQTFDALFLKTKPEAWEQLWRVHLLAAAIGTQSVLPGMMQKRSGTILNISSMAAQHPQAGQAAYASAKAGMEAMTRSLAREVGGKGIRVNAIAPGFMEGSWMLKCGEERVKKLLEEIPAHRLAQPLEIAALAVFLASSPGSYITGQVVGINGGAAI